MVGSSSHVYPLFKLNVAVEISPHSLAENIQQQKIMENLKKKTQKECFMSSATASISLQFVV